MDTIFGAAEDDYNTELWAALGLNVHTAPGEGRADLDDLLADAGDLETVVRWHGGRLPGSDPRR